MENATIFLVDDDEEVHQSFKWLLERKGHKVVLEASTLEEALAEIRDGKLQQLGVNVAIVDGSLSEKRRGCGDGHTVAKAIRDLGVHVTVIAHSGSDKEYADYGDAYVFKADAIEVMWNTISSL